MFRGFRTGLCAAILLVVSSCGGSVMPDGVFLTLSVSSRDVAVVTTVNDRDSRVNEFVSVGLNGAGSAPLNKVVVAGANQVRFSLSSEGASDPDPAVLLTLEMTLAGETVDTLSPGDRVIFSRELTDEEAERLKSGETIEIIERFEVDPDKLTALKNGG